MPITFRVPWASTFTVAFLHRPASEELRRQELDYHDPDFQVVITIRAVKPEITV